jgi:hypothetical protein
MLISADKEGHPKGANRFWENLVHLQEGSNDTKVIFLKIDFVQNQMINNMYVLRCFENKSILDLVPTSHIRYVIPSNEIIKKHFLAKYVT